jgi:L-ribulose-5-phosphate 3-epimerase
MRAVTRAGIGDEAADDLAGQLAAIGRLGWSAIELRTVAGTAIADLDDDAFAAVADRIDAAGFTVVGVASRIGNWARPITAPFEDDLRELAVLADRCARLRTRHVRVMSYPNAGLSDVDWRRAVIDRMRRLAGYAADANVVLLHENCAGWAGTSAARCAELVAEVASPALRLLFDTGNGIAHGYDAYDFLATVVELVEHVHIKDGKGNPPVYVEPGAGDARVADCVRLLWSHGYRGALSIEPHVAFQPHLGGAQAADRPTGFVACGRALDRILADVERDAG